MLSNFANFNMLPQSNIHPVIIFHFMSLLIYPVYKDFCVNILQAYWKY